MSERRKSVNSQSTKLVRLLSEGFTHKYDKLLSNRSVVILVTDQERQYIINKCLADRIKEFTQEIKDQFFPDTSREIERRKNNEEEKFWLCRRVRRTGSEEKFESLQKSSSAHV